MQDTQTLDREQILDAVIASYLRAEQEGRAPDREQMLARHPDLAEDLNEFFADRASIERLAEPARAAMAGLVPGTPVRYFGDYEILEEIARGGMGIVYRARQVSLQRIVALKMILAGRLASPAEVERFQSEARAAANLDDPNIVPIYEVGIHEGQHYFTMKLVEGGSLAQWIADFRLRIGDSRRTHHAALARLMETVARAIHFGHQRGILHRDLKPANILLQTKDGTSVIDNLQSAIPLVTDFGLAKRIEGGSDLTASGGIMGTPSYMAPEQAAGQKSLSVAVDIYSLGAVLYELLTGRPPFRAETPLKTLIEVREREPQPPRTLEPHVDRDLETICLKCLEKDPRRRYGSAEALADDLRRWQAGEPIEARPSTSWERLRKWARRRPAAAALVGVGTLAAAALLIGGLLFNAELQVALGDVKNKQADLDQANRQVQNEQEAVRKANEAARQFQEKARALEALAADRARRAEGTLLSAYSAAVRPDNPGLGLLLGIEGAKRAPGFLANTSLLAALDDCAEERTLIGHQGPVFSAVFSPDGRRVLTCAGDNTARIWDVATGKEVRRLQGPKNGPPFADTTVVVAQFSPDGRRVLTVSAGAYAFDGHNISTGYAPPVAVLWDADSGQRLARWQLDTAECRSRTSPIKVGFSPDSQRVVLTFASFPDCNPRVYDANTGKQITILKGHTMPVVSAAFSPDGKRIATASVDETARIWDAASGKSLHVIKGHGGAIVSAAFSPDGKRLLTTGDGNKYHFHETGGGSGGGSATAEVAAGRIWDVATGKEVAALRWPGTWFRASVRTAVFSRDGRRILTAGNVGSSSGGPGLEVINLPNIWDAETGKLLVTLKAEPRIITAAVFSPDGRFVATAGKDKTARLWNVADGKELFVYRGHQSAIYTAGFSPDGSRLVTSSDDGTARIWEVRTELRSGNGRHPWLAIWPVTFSPDGRRIYVPPPTPAHQFMARIIDAETGKELARAEGVNWHGPHVTVFSPDGRRLATGFWRDRITPNPSTNKVVVLDALTLKEELLLTGHDQPPDDIAFSPDGRTLLTVDGKGRIWDATSGQLLHTLDGGPQHPIHAAHYSRDSKKIVTLSAGPGYTGPGGPIEEAITADGRRVRAANPNCTARIWDSQTGKQLAILSGHAGTVDVAAFSPDGARMITGSQDGTSRIWDAATGKELFLLGNHSKPIRCAAFSPDGRQAFTGADDKVVRIWDVDTGKLRFTLLGHEEPVVFGSFSPDGKLLLTGSKDGSARLWDSGTGKEVVLLKDRGLVNGPFRAVESAAFSSDGRNILAVLTGRDHQARRSSARVWPVDLLAAALARRPRELTATERQRWEEVQRR
jgi:WD40 repeat protein/serine/threonine protein kinase